MQAIACAVAMGCMGGFAAEYFVLKDGGSDSYDGTKAAHEEGTNHGPKESIQAAVNLADGNGTIITVLPGVYDNGGGEVNNGSWPQENRVYVKANNVTIRSSTGKAEDVHIVGRFSTVEGNDHGIGEGAMRCLALRSDRSNLVVQGVTFREGATTNTANTMRGGGIASQALGSLTIIDCVVSNCAAERGGGAYYTVAHSTLFTGNYSKGSQGAALCFSRAANCLIVNNAKGSSRSPVSYMYAMANCTVANNGDSKTYMFNSVSGSPAVYNILSFGHGGNGCSDSSKDLTAYNSVFEGTPRFTNMVDTVTGADAGE